jgi:hypothetical protein
VTLVVCALWGLFGGFAVEGLELSATLRRTGRWPWRRARRYGPAPYLVSVVIRLGVGAGLAAATSAAGTMNALGALAVGASAPLIIEKLAQQVPVDPTEAGTVPPPALPRRGAPAEVSGMPDAG